ncbi:MAG: CIA30 family protein, partial [Anaerolineae bacterium]|nr:CIA30 family protein [Anaerolineae bacterium]
PNQPANQTIGPIFVEFVDNAIHSFTPGEAPPVDKPVDEGEETVEEGEETGDETVEEPEMAAAPVDNQLANFEGSEFDERWWGDAVEGAFECRPAAPGYESEQALHLTLDLAPDQYPGCGTDWGALQDWSHAEGLRFMWKSDTPGLTFSIVLMVDGTPFETYLETPEGDWTEVVIPWDAFERASWADAGGPETFDPARVESLGFGTGNWEQAQKGQIWIDDLQLVVEGEAMTPDFDKFALWTGDTKLRGANIWQRVVVPSLDGPDFWGAAR